MIIKDICNDVEFIDINILNDKLTTDGRILVHAFKKAILCNPDIIHLSLGTTRWRYKFPLKKLVNEALKKDVTIVAAASNDGAQSYPVAIKGVIGVKGYETSDKFGFYYSEGFFYAPVDTKNIRDISELKYGKSIIGNSMSAAYITAHIAMNYRLKGTKDIINLVKK
ncbi:hypothetical protein CLROS_013130 [Clostridium felsineum]|uniref:Peptidase S8/S53 domain-containing protein n=2 Tax=Clostridium felsineum TaxID=36839 RepID=A0A1S8L1D8_9CLOT|nr:hypothetical protein CLROS_013130 [Clostridium felsineum]URZ11018.1 hypothetical protein CROST_017340 [Clostridium felsineum]